MICYRPLLIFSTQKPNYIYLLYYFTKIKSTNYGKNQLSAYIRIKTNRGFPTLQNLQRFYTITYRWQEHPHKRRLFSFLLYRALLLCQLPLVLSANGTHHLHGRSRRMDLYPFRSSNMVSLPVPASGNLYFRFSGEAKLHYILSSWK